MENKWRLYNPFIIKEILIEKITFLKHHIHKGRSKSSEFLQKWRAREEYFKLSFEDEQAVYKWVLRMLTLEHKLKRFDSSTRFLIHRFIIYIYIYIYEVCYLVFIERIFNEIFLKILSVKCILFGSENLVYANIKYFYLLFWEDFGFFFFSFSQN